MDFFHSDIQDVWERMIDSEKPIVLYGMGNGADKILSVMEKYGIEVSDFFASDGFVRGHSFHGKQVLSLAQIREKYEDPFIVISFASRLPEVLHAMYTLDAEFETVAPDVPVAGKTVFTKEFCLSHEKDFERVRAKFADEESRRIYDAILGYKLTGKLSYLRTAESDPRDVMRTLVKPETIRKYADLGAYNGDTIRELLNAGAPLETVYAMEPDGRTYKKLSAYAEAETRTKIITYPYAAWNRRETLTFVSEGNRNSGIAAGSVPQGKTAAVEAEALDVILAGEKVDYVKYDVEGAEREALLGSSETICRYAPRLLVSLYHRTEDLFALPDLISELQPAYRLYLRRFPYVPAWDINLYCV